MTARRPSGAQRVHGNRLHDRPPGQAGAQRRPAEEAQGIGIGPDRVRRGAQDDLQRSRKRNPLHEALPAWTSPFRHLAPFPAADGHADNGKEAASSSSCLRYSTRQIMLPPLVRYSVRPSPSVIPGFFDGGLKPRIFLQLPGLCAPRLRFRVKPQPLQ